MNITKEQIKEWLEQNIPFTKKGNFILTLKEGHEIIEQCFNDLAPKWVSVDDRLPILRNEGKHTQVRVLATDGYEVCEISFHSGSVPTDWYEWSEYGDIEPNLITHWVPLPEPPK